MIPRSTKRPFRHISHSSAAQAGHGNGSGRRTMPTTRFPDSKPLPSGASITSPKDSCPRTSRSSPGGGTPYPSRAISRSVPHKPIDRV
ncbi:MAG TPA: hypothetical protein VH500_00405 [Nitrososphaeraceae archaeon]